MTYNAARNTATWTFPGLSELALPKGTYQVSLGAAGITDATSSLLDGDRDGVAGGDYTLAKWFRVS